MSYIGNSPTNIAFQTDTFSGTGSTTAFTMSVAPANTTSVIVAITGVLQDPSTYSVSGTTLTFSAAPPSGTSNISVRYLGIPASGVTTTAYRTVTNTTATAGQTSFTIPSYTVGYIDVFRNGVYLPTTDYTATTGTTVVLNNAATVGDTITTSSFFVSSVLNALPQTGGTLTGQLLVNSATGQNPLIAQVNSTEVMRITSSGGVSFGSSGTAYGTSGQVLTSGGNTSPTWSTLSVPAQIQPISASIAASALTISASSLTLGFRSTTLGSGTVTTVTGTPANLVVPSTATLGTVNAVQSRLIVIALNNSGTIELAVVNISGGNQLDETTLLTTTAIAAGSNSASTVYSTTARTSLAFRVIGYIESTQATAGTWATAPSTIQGQGGQALADMGSIGYSQTWQTVTGSRALSTTYYNTTGRPILVQVFTTCGTVNALNQLTINGVVVNQYCQAASVTGGVTSGIVPPMGSYSCTQGGVSASIVAWTELR